MNEQQKQQLKEILSNFSDKEKADLKQQMGVDLDIDLDPDNIDPELAKLLIDSGVLKQKPQLSKVHDSQTKCSFCGQSSDQVGALITSPLGASICRKCILSYQAN